MSNIVLGISSGNQTNVALNGINGMFITNSDNNVGIMQQQLQDQQHQQIIIHNGHQSYTGHMMIASSSASNAPVSIANSSSNQNYHNSNNSILTGTSSPSSSSSCNNINNLINTSNLTNGINLLNTNEFDFLGIGDSISIEKK